MSRMQVGANCFLFYTYWDFHYEICCLKTQFTAVYSQLNQRNDNFTSGGNGSSNHEEPVRSTGFSRLLLFLPRQFTWNLASSLVV